MNLFLLVLKARSDLINKILLNVSRASIYHWMKTVKQKTWFIKLDEERINDSTRRQNRQSDPFHFILYWFLAYNSQYCCCFCVLCWQWATFNKLWRRSFHHLLANDCSQQCMFPSWDNDEVPFVRSTARSRNFSGNRQRKYDSVFHGIKTSGRHAIRLKLFCLYSCHICEKFLAGNALFSNRALLHSS